VSTPFRGLSHAAVVCEKVAFFKNGRRLRIIFCILYPEMSQPYTFPGYSPSWAVLLTFKEPHKLFIKKFFMRGVSPLYFYSFRVFYYFVISAGG
jgi:hypothetical protein